MRKKIEKPTHSVLAGSNVKPRDFRRAAVSADSFEVAHDFDFKNVLKGRRFLAAHGGSRDVAGRNHTFPETN